MDGLIELNRIDISILVELHANGRMTDVSLADAEGLSSIRPCLQRVKRLESAGYISGYRAHLNLAEITDSVTVLTEITLSDHKRGNFAKFEYKSVAISNYFIDIVIKLLVLKDGGRCIALLHH
ncbi:winged helix-turn-helix transcriptional regulator [Pseudomonas fluorescens]|jgi:DNA-binding Lrp family transcriptional regulator|uniref:winged helix-turn-helix transcriptional regulator n=1 Tax=Pseudomonas fluorescens TaxID=294 RepID=UPI000FAF9E94|nr:winged helix-turn-helix transcriptional regulator [Pseudomonas fluorescens]